MTKIYYVHSFNERASFLQELCKFSLYLYLLNNKIYTLYNKIQQKTIENGRI